MNRVAIIGAGDLGKQIAHHARATPDVSITGFFDDFQQPRSRIADIPVLGRIESVSMHYQEGAFDSLLIGIGYKHLSFRQSLFERFQRDIPFARMVHPTAWLDETCRIEPGAIIFPGCILDMGTVVGANALLNTGCVIAHDSIIGSGCFLSPGVKLAGFVVVEPSSTLGIGTVVIDSVIISSGVRTGAGAVVTGNLSAPGLYVGVPARFKKGWLPS